MIKERERKKGDGNKKHNINLLIDQEKPIETI